jgi:hypothetical protein
MILKLNQNTPVAAPQISDMEDALSRYRAFAGEELLGMTDLISFLTSPSPEREAFLSLFYVTVTTMNNKYVKQQYS